MRELLPGPSQAGGGQLRHTWSLLSPLPLDMSLL